MYCGGNLWITYCFYTAFYLWKGVEIGKIKKNDQRCDFFENRGCGFYWLGLEAPSPAANNATVARLGRTETDGLVWCRG